MQLAAVLIAIVVIASYFAIRSYLSLRETHRREVEEDWLRSLGVVVIDFKAREQARRKSLRRRVG